MPHTAQTVLIQGVCPSVTLSYCVQTAKSIRGAKYMWDIKSHLLFEQ